MRPSLLVLLLSSFAVHAADRKPVVAVFPPASADASQRSVGLLIQARADAALMKSGQFALTHIKQIFSMSGREGLMTDQLGDAKNADSAADYLGADVYAFGNFATKKGAQVVAYTVVDEKKTSTVEAKVDLSKPETLDAAGDAIAKAVLALQKQKLPAKIPQVATGADPKALASCYGQVVRQPMGIENPSLLEQSELEDAIVQCRAVLEKSPGQPTASAALGLAYAILGSDQDALKVLKAGNDGVVDAPLYWLARFWLVTRYQTRDEGEAVLREAISKQPGFLLAHGYLGELLDTLGQHEKAADAWRAYQAVSPSDSFVQARLGKSLARLGQFDEALKRTRAALALAPDSRELQLQLASRLIDAKQLPEAITLLERQAATAEARGEVFLRLGYVRFLAGELDKAEPLFQQAIVRSPKPGDWRTRGRAHYDLAMIAAKKGEAAKADASLRAALETGYRPRQVDGPLVESMKRVERGELTKAAVVVDAGPAPKPSRVLPREVSLFPVDAFGDVDVKTPAPKPPAGVDFNLRSPFAADSRPR